METGTVIIGGGLSGLSLASQVQAAGQSFHLIEARDRLGGRILTKTVDGAAFDLGPAWFWPGQPRIAALIRDLGLPVFDQFDQGDMLYEDGQGTVHRGRGAAPMQRSFRVGGGLGTLIEGLASQLSSAAIRLNDPVVGIEQTGTGLSVRTASGWTVQAARVVLTLPPRLAAGIEFRPGLGAAVTGALSAIPTWMAGQAKALAVYDQPFWRQSGLSGDAMSHRGPLVEIHDASPMEGGPFALFGFVGVPPDVRSDEQALSDAILSQLFRLFGDDAGRPRSVLLQDWAADRFLATDRDRQPLRDHPHYGLPPLLSDIWGDRLIFAGTEVAPQFGGYLEGALEAAEDAFARIAPKVAAST